MQIGGRGGDDPQYFGRRGLLLQRLVQIVVAPLQFLEQPGVLDRDHRLISERLQERDLSVGERANRQAVHMERADRHSSAQEWHRQGFCCSEVGGQYRRVVH